MNKYMYGMLAITLLLTGCDLQQLPTDITAAVNAFQQDKSVVESLVADVKRGYTPDSPQYQSAEATYFTARRAYSQYLGQIGLAASTGDRSITPDATGEDARTAMTAFARSATASLSPNDRGLPALIAFAAFPAIHKLLSEIPSKNRVEAARSLITKVQWRSWDAVSTESDESLPVISKRKAKAIKAAEASVE
jgi:hypothetical protein